jgi:hypothetical protein
MFDDRHRIDDQAQNAPAGSAQPHLPRDVCVVVNGAQLTGRGVHSQRDGHQSSRELMHAALIKIKPTLTSAGAHRRIREGDFDLGRCLTAAQCILQERLQGGGTGTGERGDCIAEGEHVCVCVSK